MTYYNSLIYSSASKKIKMADGTKHSLVIAISDCSFNHLFFCTTNFKRGNEEQKKQGV
jgi:hypothetical protein